MSRFLAVAVMCALGVGAPADARQASSTTPNPLPESEARLIAMLKPDSPAQAKSDACRQLARVGTKKAVPALAGLLADQNLSHMARYALEAIPGLEASKALRASIPQLKGRMLTGVVNSVGVRRDALAVPILAPLLRNRDPETAASAAAALGRIGTPSAAAALEKAASNAAPALRLALDPSRLECADRLAVVDRKRALAIYDSLRASALPAVRGGAVRGSILVRGSGGVELLLKCLRSSEPQAADTALWVAQRELGGSNITRALAAALPGLTVKPRVRLIRAIGGRGDPAALPGLRSQTSSNSTEVRFATARALADLGGSGAAAVLVHMVADDDAGVSTAAKESLARLSESELAGAARELLASEEPSARIAAVELISQRGLSGFGPRLVKAVQDPDLAVRVSALTALSRLATAEDLSSLLDALARAGTAEEATAAEQAVAAACSQGGSRDAVADRVAGSMNPMRPSAKAALLRILGGIGGARALEAVRFAAQEGEEEGRTEAIRALAAWSTPDAAPDLKEIAARDGNASHRLLALRGYIRLAGHEAVPADLRLALCAEALPLITRHEEKRLWLGVAASVPAVESLKLILPLHADPAVAEEAAAATAAVAAGLLKAYDANTPDSRVRLAAVAEILESALRAAKATELQAEIRGLLSRVKVLQEPR